MFLHIGDVLSCIWFGVGEAPCIESYLRTWTIDRWMMGCLHWNQNVVQYFSGEVQSLSKTPDEYLMFTEIILMDKDHMQADGIGECDH